MATKTQSVMDGVLAGLDLDSIVKTSLHRAGAPTKQPKQVVSESYVATPKDYGQVSELVSAKTKAAHKDLYAGYVEALNRTSAELDTVDRANAGSTKSAFRDLKLTEAYSANAVWLHELYFANCFDPHSEIYMDTKSYMRLERDWGTFKDWQRDFMACALSTREGWAVMGYSTYLKRYINTMIDEHSGGVTLGLYPIIVIDMWSHAYYRDYLTDKQSFLVSQMRELNWDTIEERFVKAEKIAEALK